MPLTTYRAAQAMLLERFTRTSFSQQSAISGSFRMQASRHRLTPMTFTPAAGLVATRTVPEHENKPLYVCHLSIPERFTILMVVSHLSFSGIVQMVGMATMLYFCCINGEPIRHAYLILRRAETG